MYFKLFMIILINFCIFIYSASANALSNYQIIDYAIPLSLTSVSGNPESGRKIVISREGNC